MLSVTVQLVIEGVFCSKLAALQGGELHLNGSLRVGRKPVKRTNNLLNALLAALILFGTVGMSTVAEAGVWTPTGSMGVARDLALMVRLPDGKIFVVGGDFSGNSAEIYDPVTGLFTPAGNMTTSRNNLTATGLIDGRVLLAGGFPNAFTAELFDPATGTFTPTGLLVEGRQAHTATLLMNGKVLIAGGYLCCWTNRSSAELYDPATGTFTLTGSTSTPRVGHKATLLSDGMVLIVGGHLQGVSPTTPFSSAEVYDPATGLFTPVGNMADPRTYGSDTRSAPLLQSGKVLISGGFGGPTLGVLASAELYDPSTMTFSPTGSMATARLSHSATLLMDGRVLIAGGTNEAAGALNSAEVYNPSSGTFAGESSMTQAREGHGFILLDDGRVLVAGGNDQSGNRQSSAELFIPVEPAVPSTPGKVTGGGFIDSAGNIVELATLLIQDGTNASIGEKATFGFVVEFISGDPAPIGNLRYIDHGVNAADVKATSFETLVIGLGACGPNSHATIIGLATVNGMPNKHFKVEVDDCGEPGSGSTLPDTFSIAILDPPPLYMAAGPLIGGNIQIHK